MRFATAGGKTTSLFPTLLVASGCLTVGFPVPSDVPCRQQELEGLKAPASTVADLHRVARGEIDTDEVIRNIYNRVQNVPLLRS